MAFTNEQFTENDIQALTNYQGSIPGQSLTNSPENKYPWEQPPQFTNRKAAEIYIAEELTEKEAFINVTDMISEGITIEVITRSYLLDGFGRGLWEINLMLLLIESVAFIIMALAEKVGLDYELYQGDKDEDIDVDSEEQLNTLNKSTDAIKQGIKMMNLKTMKTSGSINPKVEEAVEDIPEEAVQEAKGLLEKDNEPPVRTSLLGAE